MHNFTISSEGHWFTLPKRFEEKFRPLIGDQRRGRVKNVPFVINSSDEIRVLGNFLKHNINAYCHADYRSGRFWAETNTIENMIWTLKNDIDPFPSRLLFAQQKLSNILKTDLPQIAKLTEKPLLTVCVVPRAKAESFYRKDQLLFRETIGSTVDQLENFENGTKYIIRHTNTRTTHLDRTGHGGDGDLPFPGITRDTCTISSNIKGKDILLIDDLYTKSINIDEDAIQALYDNGANSVTFYSIGRTLLRN